MRLRCVQKCERGCTVAYLEIWKGDPQDHVKQLVTTVATKIDEYLMRLWSYETWMLTFYASSCIHILLIFMQLGVSGSEANVISKCTHDPSLEIGHEVLEDKKTNWWIFRVISSPEAACHWFRLEICHWLKPIARSSRFYSHGCAS